MQGDEGLAFRPLGVGHRRDHCTGQLRRIAAAERGAGRDAANGAIARPPSSAYRVLHRFQEPPNVGGDNQVAPLLDVSGRLYGTTEYGGSNHNGLVYRISTGGAERLLYRFGGGSGDGINPTAGLVHVNGTLYGTTLRGGNDDCGTVYSISKSGEEKVIYNFAALTATSTDGRRGRP